MTTSPRGLMWLIDNIEQLKIKMPRDEISAMIKGAQLINGKKDFTNVYAAIRKNKVADALLDKEKAIELNNDIIAGLYQSKPLPLEYIEWLNIYTQNSTPTFFKPKPGRKKDIEDYYDEMESLNDVLLTLHRDKLTITKKLNKAADLLFKSYER